MFSQPRRAAGCVAGVSCGLWAQGRYGGFPTERLPATPGLEGAPTPSCGAPAHGVPKKLLCQQGFT